MYVLPCVSLRVRFQGSIKTKFSENGGGGGHVLVMVEGGVVGGKPFSHRGSACDQTGCKLSCVQRWGRCGFL